MVYFKSPEYFLTGGKGTGKGIGSQGGISIDDRRNRLYVVNTGSNTISSFLIKNNKLIKASTVSSIGIAPVSLTISNDGKLLYVVNTGDKDNVASIAGFRVSNDGKLTFIQDSREPLSTLNPAPAQIEFDPTNRILVVTEKDTNLIDTFRVDKNSGLPYAFQSTPSSGQTPFGFAFDRNGYLVISEAFGGMSSALSSYDTSKKGLKGLISGSIMAPEQKAACWVEITKNNRYAYTTNTASNTISSYKLKNGELELINAVAEIPGKGPIDLTITEDSYLYALNAGDDSITVFKLDKKTGELQKAGEITGLPDGAFGLVSN